MGIDPDNTTDLAGQELPFTYSWTLLSPGGLPPNPTLTPALYSASAIQLGQLSFDANALQVATP